MYKNIVIQEWTDEKGWIHRIEIPLITFLIEHNLEPVVRCKECIHLSGKDGDRYCYLDGRGITEEDYCSKGERREDGKID